MADQNQEHRIIGIRHVLRKLKDAGLVEEESLYANQAVANVRDELASKAATWYAVGARRGALEILEAILDGRLTVKRKADGTREISSSVESIEWRRRLNVSVGKGKATVPKRTYRLKLSDLDFD